MFLGGEFLIKQVSINVLWSLALVSTAFSSCVYECCLYRSLVNRAVFLWFGSYTGFQMS